MSRRLKMLSVAGAGVAAMTGMALAMNGSEPTTGLAGINWNVLAPIIVTAIPGIVTAFIAIRANSNARKAADNTLETKTATIAVVDTLGKVEHSVNSERAALLADVKAEAVLTQAELKKLRDEVSRLTSDKAVAVATEKATLVERVRGAEDKKP